MNIGQCTEKPLKSEDSSDQEGAKSERYKRDKKMEDWLKRYEFGGGGGRGSSVSVCLDV